MAVRQWADLTHGLAAMHVDRVITTPPDLRDIVPQVVLYDMFAIRAAIL